MNGFNQKPKRFDTMTKALYYLLMRFELKNQFFN